VEESKLTIDGGEKKVLVYSITFVTRPYQSIKLNQPKSYKGEYLQISTVVLPSHCLDNFHNTKPDGWGNKEKKKERKKKDILSKVESLLL